MPLEGKSLETLERTQGDGGLMSSLMSNKYKYKRETSYKYMLVQIHMEIFLHLDKASSPLLVKLSKQIVEEIVTISVRLLRCECFDQQQPADFGQACTAMCTAAICQESKIALHCHEVGGGLVRRGPGRHLSLTPFDEL